jgi:archaellum biogenesis ATPase FlaH
MTTTSTNERNDFSRFGKAFQENLVQLMLVDRTFCDQLKEVMDIQFLELKYLQAFVQRIFEYKDKYKVHPSYETMTSIIRNSLEDENEALQKQVRDYFARIHTKEIDGAEYIKDTSLDFCKKQKLKEAMLKSVKLLQTASFDEISKAINDALKLGMSNDIGYDFLVDFEKRFELKSRNPVTTGWDEMDHLCKGGLGRGELGVVVAPTGAGKSMVLVHLGTEALKHGKTVIHYTLELSDTVVASRYDSCYTQFAIRELPQYKDQIFEMIKDMPGKLIVKEYPTKTATTNSIRLHIEKLKMRGINPDMIIVDYGDLLRPISNQKEKRTELETIYEELRGIAAETNCPVWTASQTNRSGLNAEVITMESISEAFNKCFVADLIFSVSRTVEDKTINGGRIFIAKNRNGPDGLVYPISMDTSNVSIKMLPSTGETPNDIVTKSAKEQEENLKNKYKKYKRKSKTENQDVQ